MADYESDSSDEGDNIETSVLLGYVSKEPTGDDFSQLGGLPKWLDDKTSPPGQLCKCKVCNSVMSLLVQLNGDLPHRFIGHERRLYVLGCRRKPCRRKDGSVRAFRGLRVSPVEHQIQQSAGETTEAKPTQPSTNIGEALFGVKSPKMAQKNPSSSNATTSATTNPFSSTVPARTAHSTSSQATETANLSETFAQKVRISLPQDVPASARPSEPWQDDSNPYPSYYLDADKEYLDPAFGAEDVPSNARIERNDEGSSAADETILFESTMDKTFQRFADRLSQNPEQVLRYEFAGQPLLYSKSDAIGKLLSPASETSHVQTSSSRNGTSTLPPLRAPRCDSCGAARVFEYQLTPHAIIELEAEDVSIDGMDWGTIMVGACSEDCQERGKTDGEVGYVEEWVGVQWEELADNKPG